MSDKKYSDIIRSIISTQDEKKIVDIIIEQNGIYCEVNAIQETELEQFDSTYGSSKKQHSLTYSIYSGFHPSERVGDFIIEKYDYGNGLSQPKLVSDKMVILIMKKKPTAQYLTEFFEYNKNDFCKRPLFCYIRYSTNDKKEIISIWLCLPNSKGEEVHKKKFTRIK